MRRAVCGDCGGPIHVHWVQTEPALPAATVKQPDAEDAIEVMAKRLWAYAAKRSALVSANRRAPKAG